MEEEKFKRLLFQGRSQFETLRENNLKIETTEEAISEGARAIDSSGRQAYLRYTSEVLGRHDGEEDEILSRLGRGWSGLEILDYVVRDLDGTISILENELNNLKESQCFDISTSLE
jgi:prefoldin subunit 5